MVQYKKFDAKDFKKRVKEGSIKKGCLLEFLVDLSFDSVQRTHEHNGYLVRRYRGKIILSPTKIKVDNELYFGELYPVFISDIKKYRMHDTP